MQLIRGTTLMSISSQNLILVDLVLLILRCLYVIIRGWLLGEEVDKVVESE